MIFTLALAGAIASARKATELTVYNNDFALVKEQRTLALNAGNNSITVEDVAQKIEANSVGVRAVGGNRDFNVLEQNYKYDLIGTDAILQKSVGKTITLHRMLPDGKRETVKGTLLSAPKSIVSDAEGNHQEQYNGMVVRLESGEIVLNPEGTVSVDSMPDGLVSTPSLLWLVNAGQSGQADVEVSYLTKGMSWKSDYVLSLDKEGKIGDLKGWVTLTNECGTSFEGAKLKLLAGDVNRVKGDDESTVRRVLHKAMTRTPAVSAPVEEQFSEYHLYTVQYPVNVGNNEIKQVNLLDGKDIAVTKLLLFDSLADEGEYNPSEDEVGTGPIKPKVFIQLKNSKENNLGVPLPAGTFKVFQQSSSGSLEMLGEDAIQHTPKDETLKLNVGNAFDIVGERKRLNYTKVAKQHYRETFEFTVRNRKDSETTATVWERHFGDHKVISMEPKGTWLDAVTLQFVLRIPANETKVIHYTIDTKW